MTDTLAVSNAAPPLGGDAPRLHAGILLVGLATLATWLFYDPPLGVALPLFLILLCAAALALTPITAGLRPRMLAFAAMIAVLAALVNDVGTLSLSLAIIAIAGALLALTGRWRDGLGAKAMAIGALLVTGPKRLVADSLDGWAWWCERQRAPILLPLVIRWAVPVGLGLIFCLLFASANPLLSLWLSRLPWAAAGDLVDIRRLLFWVAALALIWPFLRLVAPKAMVAAARLPQAEGLGAWRALLLSPATLVRALVLFNGLFALQSALDLFYLWTGHALPDGITHASYAHQGAYPLVVTALLAAAFVLLALGRQAPSRLVTGLIIAWVAQNILLVLSAILRLAAYVAAYSLTELRLAAFVWMGLVATGLVLILVRIALDRPNRWLVGANLCTLALTLYALCWINSTALIADYNVAHCQEMAGDGPSLDWIYLARLGPQALPALDHYRAALQDRASPLSTTDEKALTDREATLKAGYQTRLADWRSWSLREERLRHYQAAHPDGIDLEGGPRDGAAARAESQP